MAGPSEEKSEKSELDSAMRSSTDTRLSSAVAMTMTNSPSKIPKRIRGMIDDEDGETGFS